MERFDDLLDAATSHIKTLEYHAGRYRLYMKVARTCLKKGDFEGARNYEEMAEVQRQLMVEGCEILSGTVECARKVFQNERENNFPEGLPT